MKKRTSTKFIVVHCSATKPSMNWGVKEIRDIHVGKNKWLDVGYHIVIKRDGTVEQGRSVELQGSHVKGHNHCSVGICLIGGINAKGEAEDNFTPAQYRALAREIKGMRALYPNAHILGHRDLSPDLNGDGKITSEEWIKECPCFDVSQWMRKEGV